MLSGEAKERKVLVESIRKYLKRVTCSVNLASEIFFIVDSRNNSFEDQKQLALLVMETLTVLLQGSNTNAGE